MAKVALYARVSTADKGQTVETQLLELRAWAARAGHEVVTFTDIASGAKGRKQRPGFDGLLRAAVRREFNTVASWSVDRMGRSLVDLINMLEELRSVGCALYLHQQGLDSSTPSGELLFGMNAIYAQFERRMIQARVKAGLARVRAQGQRLGRPSLPTAIRTIARDALLAGASVRQAAERSGCSRGTAHSMRTELVASGELAVA